MEEKDMEYAEANSVKVLETNILHASDVIYWLDGTTAQNPAEMQRLDNPLSLHITSKPRDAKIINTTGKTAILRKPINDIVIGKATETDKTRPVAPTYSFIGEAWDHDRRFNPIHFDLTLGAGNGENIVVYPSPLGTLMPPAGCLYGALHLDGGNNPLIWALLELTVEINSEVNQVYRAQCDAKGDFRIALTRLPPLPASIEGYEATLQATANTANQVDVAPDTTTYSTVQLQSASANTFGTDYQLIIIPGERFRIRSNGKDYLAASTP
jgi:hypothetical protein